MTVDRLSRQQANDVSVMWGTYASFYLGRLNLSPALPAIAMSLGIGLGEVGILGNVFFWSYAVGQIINGQLGSRVRPHWLVFLGLILVAAANIGFAFQSSLFMMAVLWGLNGFGQSMGWGPMLQVLSSHVTETQRRRLSMFFSMTFQVGTSVAWGLATLMISLGNYRTAFIVPGLLLLMIALFWRYSGLDAEPQPTTQQSSSLMALFNDLRLLLPMLFIAACIGFVYIGFLIWLPTFVQSLDFLPDGTDGVLTALIPLIGIPGMLLSGRLLARHSGLLLTLIQVMLGLLVFLGISRISTGSIQIIGLLGSVMLASGLAGLLLSSAPMLLVTPNRASSAGGLLTATWSIAGGLAGSVIGTLAERSGWDTVWNTWMALAIAALLITLITWYRAMQPAS